MKRAAHQGSSFLIDIYFLIIISLTSKLTVLTVGAHLLHLFLSFLVSAELILRKDILQFSIIFLLLGLTLLHPLLHTLS